MPASDPTDIVVSFLDRVKPKAKELLDSCRDGKRSFSVRGRGLLMQVAEMEEDISRATTRQHGELTQKFISTGNNSTTFFSEIKELYRKDEVHRSNSREEWYRGLPPADRQTLDSDWLTLAEEVLRPLFPPQLPDILSGPLARLALEYASLVWRFAVRLQAAEKSLVNRNFRNHTVVDSVLRGLKAVEEASKSRLVGRWFRELTAEQGAAFDDVVPAKTDGQLVAPPNRIVRTYSNNRVVLHGPADPPIVNGKEKDPLTTAQYCAVKALLDAGDNGLTKDMLDKKSGHGDTRKILKRLAEKDPDWKNVIHFAETTGKRYRIF